MNKTYRYAVVAVLLGCTAPILPVHAQAPECTPRILNRATTLYDLGRRDSTLFNLLRPCLLDKDGFSDDQDRIAAYRLMALSHFANHELESAKDWIYRLVHEYEDYRANPDVDPVFFQDWLETYRPKEWHQKTWVRLLGLAAVGGTATYLLTRLGEDSVTPPLPRPLGFPDN